MSYCYMFLDECTDIFYKVTVLPKLSFDSTGEDNLNVYIISSKMLVSIPIHPISKNKKYA